MELEIVEEADAVTRVILRGRLDTSGVDAVESRFNAALTGGQNGLIDMSEVTFLSSMGVRMLIAAAKTAARRGGKLVLVGPRDVVDESLRHSSIDELIPVVDDVPAGLALFS